MKKITLLLVLLFFAFSTQSNAQITTYPYSEDFESGDGGWIADNTTAGTWALGAPTGAVINSADSGANAWVTNLTGDYNTNEDSWVQSPVFDLSTLSAPSFQFSIWWNSENSWDGMVLQSSIDSGTSWQNVGAFGDANNWYTDNTINGNPGGQQEGWTGRGTANGSQGWVTARNALTGLAGQSNVVFRFAFGSDGSVQDDGIAFDTISIFDVSCPEPSGLTATGITSTSADLGWTENGTSTFWNIEVLTSGTPPTGIATAIGVSNPYSVTGLTAITSYDFYVQSDCGGTDRGTGSVSAWVGPFTFTTLCDVFIPDYFQDFSTIVPDCWDEADNGDATTGPTDLGAGSWADDGFLNNGFTGAYKINIWQAAKSDWILSPLFDLTGGPFQVEFDFGIMQFGSSTTAGTLGSDDIVQLLITTDNGTTWTPLLTWDSASVVLATGEHPVVDLTTYAGQIVQFGILGSEGVVDDTEDNDVFVDNFQVRNIPTCPDISSLTVANITENSADISWVAGGTETTWEIAIQAAGTGVPVGAGVSTSSNNPYNATGLTPSTAYEVYVRADCGGVDGFGAWIGPLNFSTTNIPPPPPVGVICNSGSSSFIFTEDFEQDPPSGWTGTGFSGDNGNWDITDGDANSGGTGPFASFSGGMHLEYEASGDSSTIASAISPAIDLTTAVDGAELSFNMHAFGADIGTLNVGIANSAAGPFTNLYTWIGDFQATDTDDWVPIGINLDAYLGQIIYIEFSYGGAGTGFEGDMSIDLFRVESCGSFCIAPSVAPVTNITGTTADFNWTANSGETAWEYVVSLAGTGEPAGAGNPVATTTINETGLAFSTDYELWVRADCGGGNFSVWAGPINFTTTIQTNFSVDCTLGPINSFLCYGNNDSELFTYTSSDGSPLNLTINSGEIEGAPFDFLLILDSDGVTELYNGEGNNGILDGLTFQSTGDTIFIQILSDGSVSCESGSFCCSSGIDFTVACATCINPTATYQVVDDCANGDQFLIDVDVTSLGDATSVSISDNQGSTPVSVSTTGVTQFGPYPFLVDVIITISNEQDVNCVINSAPIQLLACPPDNDNCDGATVALVNDDGSCDLVTPGTILAATPSGVPVGSCAGNPDDDVWFQFTALSEVQLISLININGGFNLDHGLYEGSCGTLTELYCSDGDASVTPQLIIGNTYYVRVFSGGSSDEITTFDLCIREAPTNIICENAENFCSDGGALTSPNIIGIPDPTDIACLFSAPNPTWNIIQIGDPGLIEIEINQTSDAGVGLDVDFVLWGPFTSLTDACGNLDLGCPNPGGDCPTNVFDPNFYPFGNIMDCSYSAAATENLTIDNALAGEIYILLVTNFSNDPGNITITQTNGGGGTDGTITAEIEAEITSNEVVFVDDDSDPGTPDVAAVCGFDSVTIEADSPFADSYIWYADGFVIAGETSATLTVTESNTYQVQAFDEQCDTDAFSQIVVVKLYKDPGAIGNLNLTVCDGIEADGVEDFDLDALAATIGLSTDFVVSYYATQADANQAINALTSPYNTAGETIYFRIEDVEAANDGFLGCRQLSEVTLLVNPIPTANQPQDLLECNNNGSFDFDLTSQDAEINSGTDGGDIVITYYATQEDADNGTNALSSPYNSADATIYVRVEDTTTGCFNTTSFNVVLDIVPLAAFNNTIVDYEVCPNATVPILISLLPSNFTESEVTVEWFLDDGLIAGESGLTLPVLVQGDYTAVITFNTTGCFNTIIETVIELESCVIPQGISPGEVDGLNDTFDLSSYNVTKLEIFNRNGTRVYSKTNYIDEWHGQSDAGDELPVGTYFYTMIYEGGAKKRSAWIYINR